MVVQISEDISFQECRACEKRFVADHQDATRRPKCSKKSRKRKNSGSKKTQDKNQIVRTAVGDRTLRPGQNRNYAIPDSDDEDIGENPEEI